MRNATENCAASLIRISEEIGDLLAAERGNDGTYEVPSIEVDVSDLIEWATTLAECAGVDLTPIDRVRS